MKSILRNFFIPLLLPLCFLCGKSQAGLFSIEVNNLGGLTPSQSRLFDDAVAYWQGFLTGVQANSDHTLTIYALGAQIDGKGGVLGQAGPIGRTVYENSLFAYSVTGIMRFDTEDLVNLERQNTLFDVIIHEMAHVIGFGTLWDQTQLFPGSQSVYKAGSGRYTGSYALNTYQEEFNTNASFIPVERDGGSGTEDSHWDEQWLGGSSELMTGYLESRSTYLSNTTIASFADIGYETVITHAVNESPVALLFIFSLMVMKRKYRKRKTAVENNAWLLHAK